MLVSAKPPLILAVDPGGQPRQWITWEEAVAYHAKDLILWQFGDHDFTFYGGTNVDGCKSEVTINSIVAIKGIETLKVTKWERETYPTKHLLFRRDRHMCAYCGDIHSEEKLTRDHIVPESKGGATSWMNLVTACKPCNQRKSDKSLSDSGMQLLYVPYIPSRNERMILSNRKILTDQMDFLMPGVPHTSRLRTN